MVARLTICNQTASADTWRRAIDRARTEGVKVLRDGDAWQATSVSRPGRRHQVNGHCDCEGAQRGLLCKHFAAVVAARFTTGELAKCAWCGRVGPVERMESEWRHVGGRDDRQAWYCGEGYGHRASN